MNRPIPLPPITFLLWFWKPKRGQQYYIYTTRRVNAVADMIRRHYHAPHRIVCITDAPEGIDCETFPLWGDWRGLPVPANMPPQSWARLGIFRDGRARELAAEHVVSVDLDCVIIGDITSLFAERHDFKGWLARGYRANPCIYNASLFMLKLDAFPSIVHRFDPVLTPHALKLGGWIGTEQAWMSFVLGREMPAWSWRDGVSSYRLQVKAGFVDPPKCPGALPEGTTMVFFHGSTKPWTCHDKFVLDHYPEYAR